MYFNVRSIYYTRIKCNVQCVSIAYPFLDLSEELYSLTVSIYWKRTDTMKEDRKNQTKKKNDLHVPSVFRSQIEEADQVLKYTMIYMDRSLNPLFVTLQEIDKSKGWKSSLELVEISHVDIVIFANTSPITSQLHVMT